VKNFSGLKNPGLKRTGVVILYNHEKKQFLKEAGVDTLACCGCVVPTNSNVAYTKGLIIEKIFIA
jgi:hypothetical protein